MNKNKDKGFIKHVPNILTVARLVFTTVFFWMLFHSDNIADQSRTLFLDIAFVFFVITGLTDIADGYLARKFEVTSKFGRIVDPLADKYLVVGSFICFAFIGEPQLFPEIISPIAHKIIHWSIVVILISREVSVTMIRQWAESHNINFGASVYGKLKMFTQSFGIGTVLVKMTHVQTATWGYWFTAITFTIMVLATVISGAESIIRVVNAKKKMKL